MRFSEAIDAYIRDQRFDGRINSPRTERDYRYTLGCHAEDVDNRDPRKTGRDDVKRTLARWPHPNSRAKARSIMVSFYAWMVETGERDTNPGLQVKRPKRRQPQVYRLTKDEVVALLQAARGTRERRLIHIGTLAGLRSQELRGLQGKHFLRDRWIWVSADIAKGSRERWVPVLPDLEPVYNEIRQNVKPDEYVLPAQRFRDPGINRDRKDYTKHPASPQAVWRLVGEVGKRAGVPAPVHPHLLRHAFADHVARTVGVEIARTLLGHRDLRTTQSYIGEPTLDELAESIRGLTYGLSLDGPPSIPLEAPTGIEPVPSSSEAAERFARVLEKLWTQFEPLRTVA